MKKSVGNWAERTYPLLTAAVFCGAYMVCMAQAKAKPFAAETFQAVMDDVIGVASILTGLLGAIVGVMFSLSETERMQHIMEVINWRRLKSYIEIPMWAGIALILLTLVLRIAPRTETWVQAVYLSMTIWLLLSFCRVAHILLKQCFVIIKPRSARLLENYTPEEQQKLRKRIEKAPIHEGSAD